ncbi:MAG TPA: substrate-binding domain-containing protein [Puia sp.]
MKKKVALKDIAERVGVSIALVSYVLNNQRENRVSKEIAKKIRDTAKKMNYRTNQIARSLKTNKTATFGLIVADISNPFSSHLARIIEDEAAKSHYTVLFGSSDENEEKSQNLINVFLDRQVDGLIIAPAENTESQLRALQKAGTPFVLIDRYFPELRSNYVALDNFKAAHTAVKHLIQEGNRRIGLITFETELFHLQERKRGYLAALKEFKISFKKDWVKEIGMEGVLEGVEKAITELLDLPKPPDALFFISNTLSIYGIKYINKLDIRVPDTLAIVSFDETEASDIFYAPLTYIRQPLKEMGQLATQILIENIGKKNIRQMNLDGELLIRKSSIRTKTRG